MGLKLQLSVGTSSWPTTSSSIFVPVFFTVSEISTCEFAYELWRWGSKFVRVPLGVPEWSHKVGIPILISPTCNAEANSEKLVQIASFVYKFLRGGPTFLSPQGFSEGSYKKRDEEVGTTRVELEANKKNRIEIAS